MQKSDVFNVLGPGQIKDTYVQASLYLAEVFGLRREEAIKFMPAYADQGNHIQLKASW
jgi:Integrase